MSNPDEGRNDPAASSPIGDAYRGWDRFWFAPADPLPLGLMRICCGLIALYVHVIYCFYFQELFGEDGWQNLATANLIRLENPVVAPASDWDSPNPSPYLPDKPEDRQRVIEYYDRWGADPRVIHGQGEYSWSIWFHVTDPTWMNVFHASYLVVLVLFTVGWQTRITSALSWVGALGYIHRAPMTLFGMDTVLALVILYLTIGPSGAALSIDRLFSRFRARRDALRWGKPIPSGMKPERLVSANFALRLMQVHLCFIYLASGLAKLQGYSWWNASAIWRPAAGWEYAPLEFDFYDRILHYMIDHRLLWEIFFTAGTVLTLVVEIGFPFLVWNRKLRWVMIGLAWLLHVGIGMMMGLATFSFIMMTLVCSFIPAEDLRRVGTWISKSAKAVRNGKRSTKLPAEDSPKAASTPEPLDSGNKESAPAVGDSGIMARQGER